MASKELPEKYLKDPELRHLLMPVDTNINIDSVILSDANKEKIAEFINEIKHSELLFSNNLHPINRILMYGDSGTGKTFLTKALANYLGRTMLYIDIGAALNTGNIAENLTKIFKVADEIGECIIFLDECDSIGWNREGTSRESGEVRRATNNLFQLIDQMSPRNILIGCTNMLQMLDPAFARRFELKMQFFRPEGNLEDVIEKFLFRDKGFTLKKDFDLDMKRIVERRLEVSYYEIQSVVERSMKYTLLESEGKSKEVSETEVYRRLAIMADIDFKNLN